LRNISEGNYTTFQNNSGRKWSNNKIKWFLEVRKQEYNRYKNIQQNFIKKRNELEKQELQRQSKIQKLLQKLKES
jgi:hypothetical protein